MRLGTKGDEAIFREMMTDRKIWCHKWKDVTRCPYCKQIFHVTNRDQAVEEESIVDYLVINNQNWPAWVECKAAIETLKFSQFSLPQLNFLNGWTDRKATVFLFLVQTDKDKFVERIYLIPWHKFRKEMRMTTKKSMNKADMAQVFILEEILRHKSTWIIPAAHIWWEWDEKI